MTAITLAGIEAAARSISAEMAGTPQFEDPGLTSHFGHPVIVKVETLNLLRSFKGRGADYFMSTVPEGASVVTASAGNFGQAIAWAGARRSVAVHVFAAVTANPRKVERMRELGAHVTLIGDDFDAAKEAAKELADSDESLLFVEDGREPAISEGAATIAVELAGERLDTLLVPLGNGALITGVGTWLKKHSPQTKVIGVVAAGAPCMAQSWEEKRFVTAPARTIADGIAIRTPVQTALDWMESTVDDVVRVGEDSIVDSLVLIRDKMGLILEPSAAVGIAALLDNPELRSGRVGTIFTGANISAEATALIGAREVLAR